MYFAHRMMSYYFSYNHLFDSCLSTNTKFIHHARVSVVYQRRALPAILLNKTSSPHNARSMRTKLLYNIQGGHYLQTLRKWVQESVRRRVSHKMMHLASISPIIVLPLLWGTIITVLARRSDMVKREKISLDKVLTSDDDDQPTDLLWRARVKKIDQAASSSSKKRENNQKLLWS